MLGKIRVITTFISISFLVCIQHAYAASDSRNEDGFVTQEEEGKESIDELVEE